MCSVPRSGQHLAVDIELPNERAGESADLQVLSGSGAEPQLGHSVGRSPIQGAQLSNTIDDISINRSQSESRDGTGEQQQAAVERAEAGMHATAMGCGSDSGCTLGQLLSEQQLWDAAWMAFEPHEAHQHLSTLDRRPSRPERDAAHREESPSSIPSLAARLFGAGNRSRHRNQRCAQSAGQTDVSPFVTSPACCRGRQANAAGGWGYCAHACASFETQCARGVSNAVQI